MSVTNAQELAAASDSERTAQRKLVVHQAIQILGMLPILLLLCIAFHFLSDYRFFSWQNISIVMQQASVNTVLAAGMTIVILTGGIDLSVGSLLAVSAMAAIITSKIPGFGPGFLLHSLSLRNSPGELSWPLRFISSGPLTVLLEDRLSR